MKDYDEDYDVDEYDVDEYDVDEYDVDEYAPHFGDTSLGELLGSAIVLLSLLGGIALVIWAVGQLG